MFVFGSTSGENHSEKVVLDRYWYPRESEPTTDVVQIHADISRGVQSPASFSAPDCANELRGFSETAVISDGESLLITE